MASGSWPSATSTTKKPSETPSTKPIACACTALADLLAADQPLHQPGGRRAHRARRSPDAAAKNSSVLSTGSRKAMCSRSLGTCPAGPPAPAPASGSRGGTAGRDGSADGRQVAEVALRRGEPLLRRDVADQGEHAVVGAVVATEEVVHVLEAGRVEVLHRPDRRVVVGVPGGEHRGVHLDEGRAVGHVVVALALLLLDHVPLVVEVLLRDRVEQVPVPVGLHPEGQLVGTLGDGLEVVGAVEPGRRVEAAALGHQPGEVLAAGDVPRPLEHQVLEEVGEAGAPGRPRGATRRSPRC